MAARMDSSQRSIGAREFVFILALMQALQALAIDAMLPALGAIAQDLNVSDPNRRQLVVGIFLIGIGVGSLIPGALSDRFGRRPVLFASLGFYIVPMLACALVRDFNTLVVLRLVQAIGCSGLAVIPPAIIRDRFDGDKMARLQSLISVIFLTIPMLAPSIGQLILEVAGWRWIFGFMALLGVLVAAWAWLRLPETLHPEFRQPVRIGAVLGNFSAVLRTRASIGYVLASSCTMTAIWGFINSSQQLVAEHFGAGKNFPYIFGAMAAGMALANFVNSRIVERFGARRVSHAALLTYVAVASAQVFFAFGPHQTLWQFVVVMALTMALGGFMGANFGAIALQPFARTAGAAASVHGFLRTMLGALGGMAIGQSFDGTARPFALGLLACGIVALGLVLFSEQGRLFRRLNPPQRP